MNRTRALAFGVAFGFVLSRAGATSYDSIRSMFALTDLRLAGVICVAIAVSGAGFAIARQTQARSLQGEPLVLAKKPMKRGLVLGSLLFGMGWAVSGTCPGTALAQLGEGRLSALATLGGILLSSLAIEVWQARPVRATGAT
jgi:uncharacterized membrane protein YedE/YeeE